MFKIETLGSVLALYRGGHNNGFYNVSDNHLLCKNHIMSQSTSFVWRQENEFPSMPFCSSLALNCMRTNLLSQRRLSVNWNWISDLKIRKLKQNWALSILYVEFLITLSIWLCKGNVSIRLHKNGDKIFSIKSILHFRMVCTKAEYISK